MSDDWLLFPVYMYNIPRNARISFKPFSPRFSSNFKGMGRNKSVREVKVQLT